ncbi:hypothetical protein CFAEC_01640 [Corynebacterium faecale]|uniref:DUF2505 domain-containing protein n=1 Tax=Corynebacterium faecale TaxID=1758466 RepID=UPI0025B3D286|nr:DUF2505 domain-containing protein [Corynebacterium faecale]WJY91187.1 hypothetical protein CFAEC_01640 [Corynebacterium faecale]
MATRTENTVTINQSAEKVHQALTNQEYWAYIAENLSPEPGEVNSFTETDGGAEVVLFEILPLDVLPEAVRAMISQALKVKRVITVSALNDGTAHIDYNADVKGTPVDFKGTIGLAGDDTSTTLAYNNEVSVNIPFMGPAIEPKVADALGELFANEGALTDKWISENL